MPALPEPVACAVPDTTLVAALALVLVDKLPVSSGAVGLIVVLGRTTPLGPNTTVVPSKTAVVLLFRLPAPIR